MKLAPLKNNEPVIMSTVALLKSAAAVAVANCDSKNDIDTVPTKILFKNLLNTSSSSSIAQLTVTAATSSTTLSTSAESMITKEVNDTQLNLTKILYEPDKHDSDTKEKNNSIVDSLVDDDDRLVIDISDDENKGRRKRKPSKGKAMPLLEDGNLKFNSKFNSLTLD